MIDLRSASARMTCKDFSIVGQQDSSVGKGTWHQAGQPEFILRKPHGGHTCPTWSLTQMQ